MKILMVCLGNICRSPLAEGIMRDKIKKYGLHVEVDSCGIGNWHVGENPDKRAQKTAKNHGIDISNLKGRQISFHDFNDFDIIYVMDNENYKELTNMVPHTEAAQKKIKMLMNEIYPGKNIPVPDPYWGTDNDFEAVWLMLDEACEVIVKNMMKK